MNRSPFLLALILAVGLPSVGAAAESTATNYDAARKEASARYTADKKLCADESTSKARMQCLRDAKAEYDNTLTEAKKRFAAEPAKSAKAAAPVCASCGKVLGVVMGERKGKSSPVGIIGGGVAGALIGNQIGGGTGKDIATIAGAAGGAYAGSKIEEKVRATKIWTVSVRFEDGKDRSFTFEHDPGFAAGDPVKLSGNTVVRR